jgi:hypothetical protein
MRPAAGGWQRFARFKANPGPEQKTQRGELMNAQCLLRFGDICSWTDWDIWDKIEAVLRIHQTYTHPRSRA